MRTTVRLDDELYRGVEAQAAREGRTVDEVIEDALRLRHRRDGSDASFEPLPVHGGSGVMPGVDLGDTAALRDVMDAHASSATPYRVVSFRSLERIARRVGLDEAGLARFLGRSTKTLKRRAAKGVLNEAESMKTEMLANTLNLALRIMGDEAKARRWLASQVASLDGLRPIDHLNSIDCYERVREALTKIEYGMY